MGFSLALRPFYYNLIHFKVNILVVFQQALFTSLISFLPELIHVALRKPMGKALMAIDTG